MFENTLVSKNDICDLTETYALEEGKMSQPQKMLISSCTLQNGALLTALFYFCLQLGLFVIKICRFVTSGSGRKKDR